MWTGTVLAGSTVLPLDTALLADGTARVHTNGGGGTGTWTLGGTTLTMTITADGSPGTVLNFTGALTDATLRGSGNSGATTFTFNIVHAPGAFAGIWKGTYGNGAGALVNDDLVLLYASGVSEIHDGAALTATAATGTWGTPPGGTDGGKVSLTREK